MESQPQLSTTDADVGLWHGLKELYAHVPRSRRRQFVLVIGLMLLSAVAELASIGAIIPFLSLLADPDALAQFPWALGVFDALGARSASQRLVLATVSFATFVLLAGALRLQLAWFVQDFIFRLGHDLAVEIQRRILFQAYSFHVQRNTSTLLSAVEKTETLIFHLLLPLMQATTAAIISLFIILALVYIDPLVAGAAGALFGTIYLLVSAFTGKRLRSNSAEVGSAWDERLKTVQESLGGIRDVIIDNSQAMYLDLFGQANHRLSLARANTAFIASAPRFIIEAVGMAIIALVALVVSQREAGIAAALPILGAVALGAQRLLPLLQQIYGAWSNAAGNRSILLQVLDLLRLPIGEEYAGPARAAPLPLRDRIAIENLSFEYPGRRRPAIEDVSLEIPVGSTIALVGETGSGKSTLADLLMGLLEPGSGRISIDGVPLTRKNRRRWQRSIAHVPQSIFLVDASIARNIALGRPDQEVDFERVVEAAKAAQLHDFILSLPEAYDTFVGERGIRLSGGQRQRLGIARAIYKQTPVLVLDEATSALDEATELAVFEGLQKLRNQGRTLFIIAHRLSTIARSDRVVRLHDGRIVEIGGIADAVQPGSALSRRGRG